MTLPDLQPLLESPFRNYANFSGRAGRAEFWLFLLSLFVATNLAWIIGYGGMMLAGYQSTTTDTKHTTTLTHRMMIPERTARASHIWDTRDMTAR